MLPCNLSRPLSFTALQVNIKHCILFSFLVGGLAYDPLCSISLLTSDVRMRRLCIRPSLHRVEETCGPPRHVFVRTYLRPRTAPSVRRKQRTGSPDSGPGLLSGGSYVHPWPLSSIEAAFNSGNLPVTPKVAVSLLDNLAALKRNETLSKDNVAILLQGRIELADLGGNCLAMPFYRASTAPLCVDCLRQTYLTCSKSIFSARASFRCVGARRRTCINVTCRRRPKAR